METGTIVLIIVIVVVVLALAGLAAWMGDRKRRTQKREQAEQLRQEAATEASGVNESEARAREAEARAEQAKLEAQRAEEEAARAKQGVAQEHALHEDKVREADRLDPDVDHRADDYAPNTPTPTTEKGRPAQTSRPDETSLGTGAAEHRGEPVAERTDGHGRPVEESSESRTHRTT